MARNREPIVKRCRALGISPAELGYSKESNREPKRMRKKQSEYGMQLQEKQKAKFIYGVMEKPFRNYFEKAKKLEGPAGENLIIMLEQRFDNVVFRAGFGKTRRECRQMVVHNHFTINGKKANIPSMQVKVGDVVAVCQKSQSSVKFKTLLEELGKKAMPQWIERAADTFEAKIVALPAREDIDFEVSENLIVELYSR